MKFDFDLQMFADDAAVDEAMEEAAATEDAAESTAEPQEDAGEPEGDKDNEPIPDELSGVSETIARDIMRKAREQTEARAEQDGDNKLEATADPTKTKVPYERFKAKVDKERELEAQLEKYRQKYGDIDQQPAAQPTQPPVQQPIQQPPMLPILAQQLSPQDFKLINDAIHVGAMQLSGMTQKDVDAIQYLEEDDPRVAQWRQANEMAKSQIYSFIQREQQRERAAAQYAANIRNISMESYKQYAREQSVQPEYKEVRDFAIGEFLDGLSEVERVALISAHENIAQNRATPAETMLVCQYFEKAKRDYAARKAQPNKQESAPRVDARQPAFPKSSNVHGTGGVAGGVTADSLAKMMHEKPWREIPQEYRDMLMGLSNRVTVRKE